MKHENYSPRQPAAITRVPMRSLKGFDKKTIFVANEFECRACDPLGDAESFTLSCINTHNFTETALHVNCRDHSGANRELHFSLARTAGAALVIVYAWCE